MLKLFSVAVVMALMCAALLMTNSGFKLMARRKSPAESGLLPATVSELSAGWWTTTPDPYRKDLKGKMFTLSSRGEGIQFYPPHYSDAAPPYPESSTAPYKTSTQSYSTATESYRPPTQSYTTKRPTTTPRHTHYWTTASPTTGVSVCLRYLIAAQRDDTRLFTLSPSTNPLRLSVSYAGIFSLPFQSYPYVMYMTPSIRLWRNIDPEMWTRVCLTVDNKRNVVQLFSGSNMSIRHILPVRYAWSGEPVVDVSGFDGQVTDIQVWDYPLRYKEVFNYMTNGVYASYRGSVITWSSIGYSLRGNALLEDVYEKQASQPISKGGERRLKGERKTRVVFKEGKIVEGNKEWFK